MPIGARRFGRVRSPRVHSSVPGDLDVDGIPNPLDIDDDGDRILDNIDRRSSVRATQAAQEFAFELNLSASIDQTANANAAGLTDAQMDALLSSRGTLGFDVVGGGSSELDCGSPQSRTDPRLGGLSYCTRGGTGRATQPDTGVELGPFPECCDSDGDGFGTLTRHTLLRHGATSAQIGTGDVLNPKNGNRRAVRGNAPVRVRHGASPRLLQRRAGKRRHGRLPGPRAASRDRDRRRSGNTFEPVPGQSPR